MKTPLTLFYLLLAVCATAQDTRNYALFKEGTRLEYKTYVSVPGMLTSTIQKVETTRLILTVDSVKENDGVIAGYITKKGIASNNPKYKYTKNFTLKSDGKRTILPFVLYMTDTIYGCDAQRLTGGQRMGGVYMGIDYPVNGLAFLVPSSFDGVHDIEFDKRKTKARGGMMRFSGDMDFTMRKMYVDGKEKITTKAGEFDCYKIIWEADCLFSKRHIIIRTEFFYNEQTGLIKAEYDGGSIELVDVR